MAASTLHLGWVLGLAAHHDLACSGTASLTKTEDPQIITAPAWLHIEGGLKDAKQSCHHPSPNICLQGGPGHQDVSKHFPLADMPPCLESLVRRQGSLGGSCLNFSIPGGTICFAKDRTVRMQMSCKVAAAKGSSSSSSLRKFHLRSSE